MHPILPGKQMITLIIASLLYYYLLMRYLKANQFMVGRERMP
jgi:hypothetical protein